MLDAILLGLLAQAPLYSADALVNAASGRPGCFAPNSLGVLYGANFTYGGPFDASREPSFPTSLNDTLLYLNRDSAPLVYVSATQINFWIPARILPQSMPVRVVNKGFYGPTIDIVIVAACPELFTDPNGFAAASHPDGAVVTPANPARPGGVVVLYGTGFGATAPVDTGRARPTVASPLVASDGFFVELDDQPVPASQLWYAGLTPGFHGLYQVNLTLPDWTPANPLVRVRAAGAAPSRAVRLAVQPGGGGNPTAEPRVLH